MNRTVGIVSVCLALILPAVARPHQKRDSARDVAPSTSSQTSVCARDAEQRAVTAEYVWRLRAYDDLDCALAILDEALKTPGDVITLSREEAEQARARVWAARDAAARIGR